MPYAKNEITPIDDLLELQDIHLGQRPGPNHMQPPPRPESFPRGPINTSKYIRKHSPPNRPPPMGPPVQMAVEVDDFEDLDEFDEFDEEEEEYMNYDRGRRRRRLTCVEVWNHIENCPICKQLYKCDKTIYWIVIAVLSIIIVFLIKKIMCDSNNNAGK